MTKFAICYAKSFAILQYSTFFTIWDSIACAILRHKMTKAAERINLPAVQCYWLCGFIVLRWVYSAKHLKEVFADGFGFVIVCFTNKP